MMQQAYQLAQAEIGTFEWREGSNPKVLAYFKDAGHSNISDDDVPWCAAFVGAMLKRAGMKGTGKLNARSYEKWGKPVDIKDAQPGDICVFKRGSSSWQGHVAFYAGQTTTAVKVLGGNQSDAVNVKPYSRAKLLAVRRLPDPMTKPKGKGRAVGVGGAVLVAIATAVAGWGEQIKAFFAGLFGG